MCNFNEKLYCMDGYGIIDLDIAIRRKYEQYESQSCNLSVNLSDIYA